MSNNPTSHATHPSWAVPPSPSLFSCNGSTIPDSHEGLIVDRSPTPEFSTYVPADESFQVQSKPTPVSPDVSVIVTIGVSFQYLPGGPRPDIATLLPFYEELARCMVAGFQSSFQDYSSKITFEPCAPFAGFIYAPHPTIPVATTAWDAHFIKRRTIFIPTSWKGVKKSTKGLLNIRSSATPVSIRQFGVSQVLRDTAPHSQAIFDEWTDRTNILRHLFPTGPTVAPPAPGVSSGTSGVSRRRFSSRRVRSTRFNRENARPNRRLYSVL